MMQNLSRFSLPGKQGCPDVFQLCVFTTKNDVYFVGFIPSATSPGVQVYPSNVIILRDEIKQWMPVISDMNTPVKVTPTLTPLVKN